MTSSNLNHLLNASSLNIITVGVRASIYEFGGGHSSVHSTRLPIYVQYQVNGKSNLAGFLAQIFESSSSQDSCFACMWSSFDSWCWNTGLVERLWSGAVWTQTLEQNFLSLKYSFATYQLWDFKELNYPLCFLICGMEIIPYKHTLLGCGEESVSSESEQLRT